MQTLSVSPGSTSGAPAPKDGLLERVNMWSLDLDLRCDEATTIRGDGRSRTTGGQGPVEPINYRRAILRRWPLILAIAVILAVVAVLVPVHKPQPSQSMWQATALAGVPPSRARAASQASSSLDQIKFFAEQEQVYVNTANVLHEEKGTASSLRKDISLKPKKGLPAGSIDVVAKQLTKQQAAKLANTFVKQLGIYANQQLASQYNASLKQAQDRCHEPRSLSWDQSKHRSPG